MFKWKSALINFAFKVLDKHVVDKLITYEPLHQFVETLMGTLRKVVERLTDKDPNNKEQLQQLWEEEKDNLFDNSLEIAAAIVRDKIKDEETAAMVSQLLLDLKDEETV